MTIRDIQNNILGINTQVAHLKDVRNVLASLVLINGLDETDPKLLETLGPAIAYTAHQALDALLSHVLILRNLFPESYKPIVDKKVSVRHINGISNSKTKTPNGTVNKLVRTERAKKAWITRRANLTLNSKS
jgi:hypothetical protein